MQLAKWFSILSLLGFSAQLFGESSHGPSGLTSRPLDSNIDEVFSYPLTDEDQTELAKILEEFSPKPRATGELPPETA